MTEPQNTPELRFPEFDDEWKDYQLQDVIKVNSGKDYKHLNSGTYPVYGTGGYMLSVSNYLYENDAIGIGRKGTINKPFLLKGPFWTVDTLFYCTPLNKNNLYFILSLFKKINWKKYDESTGVPSLSKVTINKVKCKIPPTLEQIKIGKFFSKLDRQIELEEEKLELLEEQKKGYIQKIFSQELRFKDDNGCYYSNWEMKKLDKIAYYRRGSFPQPYGNKEWYDELNGEPFVQVVDVDKNMKLHEQTKQRISDLAKPKSVKGYKGDVVVTLQGSIGRVAILQYDAYIDRTLLLINSFKIDINKNYFKYALYLLFLKEKEKAPGGTIKTITKTVLSNFIISVPSIKEQVKIGNFLERLDYLIEKQSSKVELLKQRKQGLLQKMFV
ncbi:MULTISPECIES: restriction endonuclease subunit S [unclassified Staphylococcus]|uniref:restriction endonuclease subunit S n=1 Tax=unclassified Staphylococcus TaxID=91994 RepID=UPI001950CAD1|nr:MULTISPECIES: restriction endonuclease subunit S [unclassified Staphylococcus]